MSIDALIAKYKRENEEFEFTVSGGDVLKARRFADAEEYLKLEKHASSLYEVVQKESWPPGWVPYLPLSKDAVRMAAYFEALMVEPPFNFVEGLQVCKTCGVLALEIIEAITPRAIASAVESFDDKVQQEKNG